MQELRDVNHGSRSARHHLGQDAVPFGQEEVLQILGRERASVFELLLRIGLTLGLSDDGLGVNFSLGEFLTRGLNLLLGDLFGLDRDLVFRREVHTDDVEAFHEDVVWPNL